MPSWRRISSGLAESGVVPTAEGVGVAVLTDKLGASVGRGVSVWNGTDGVGVEVASCTGSVGVGWIGSC